MANSVVYKGIRQSIAIILLICFTLQSFATISQAEVKSFNEKEKKAYEIAKSHLGMSFDLEKSIGFREWKQKQRF